MDAFQRRKRQSHLRNGEANDIELANAPSSKEDRNVTRRERRDRERVNHNGHKVTKHIAPEGESGRSGFHPLKFLTICFRSASPASAVVNVLWPVVPGKSYFAAHGCLD